MELHGMKFYHNAIRTLKIYRTGYPEGLNKEEFIDLIINNSNEIRQLHLENMDILNHYIYPAIDSIEELNEQDLKKLIKFSNLFMKDNEVIDVGLYTDIHSNLLKYAKKINNKDLIIKELYYMGMAKINFNRILDDFTNSIEIDKQRSYFYEAASYLDNIDEIESLETRDYINRSLVNIAISHTYEEDNESKKRLQKFREVISLFNNQDYRNKTPDLPWEEYLYSLHCARTILVPFLLENRVKDSTIQKEWIHDIWESIKFINQIQIKREEKGVKKEIRWIATDYCVRYLKEKQSGDKTIDLLLELITTVEENDYSDDGIFVHLAIPARILSIIKEDMSLFLQYKDKINLLYEHIIEYTMYAPDSSLNETLLHAIKRAMYNFIEFEGGISFSDFFLLLVANRHPQTYVHSLMVAEISKILLHRAILLAPQEFCRDSKFQDATEILESKDELLDFIYYAGIFHDLGKMISLQIFSLYSRKLYQEEFYIIKEHPQIGYSLLRKYDSTKAYANIALGHHKFYNNQGGYPANFNRNTIECGPFVDIVSVADTIDAATDTLGRIYAQPKTYQQVKKELIEGRGEKYSPFVVSLLEDTECEKEILDLLEHGRIGAFSKAFDQYQAIWHTHMKKNNK